MPQVSRVRTRPRTRAARPKWTEALVAPIAKRLPVCRIPEQRLIALVRHDMVDELGGLDHAVSPAADTQRLPLAMRARRQLPEVVVSSSARSATSLGLVLLPFPLSRVPGFEVVRTVKGWQDRHVSSSPTPRSAATRTSRSSCLRVFGHLQLAASFARARANDRKICQNLPRPALAIRLPRPLTPKESSRLSTERE